MKRIITFLLVCLMVAGLFAGCTNNETPSTAPSSAPSASPSEAPETTDPEEDEPVGGLPITAEKTTLTNWKTIQTLSTVFTDWNECAGYQEIEKRTNIHIDFTIAPNGNESETFNLLMASQQYPDIIEFFSSYYTRGVDDAIDQEIIIRLNDVIDEYMPNYKALISNPERALKTKADTGNIGLLYCIYNQPQFPWAGLSVRQDWIDDLGLETPRTYGELHDVLTAFKEQKGAIAPLLLGPNGDTALGNCWSGGFQAINGMMQIDGTVYYGPLLDGYREYLETFANWYSEGLIDRDFTTSPGFLSDTSRVYRNEAGVWFGFGAGDYEALHGQPEDLDFLGYPIQNPVKNRGETSHFKVMSDDVGIGSAISADCDKVEIAARWLDYCYSEEGSLYLNFGIEGETFIFDENNEPMMNAEGIAAKYGMPFSSLQQSTGPIEAPYLRHMYRNTPIRKSTVPLSEYSAYLPGEIWGQDGQDWIIPTNISPTADEGNEYTRIFADINTLVTETTVRIIIGADTISAYDEMVAKVRTMGIDTAIALRQAAVTRYFNRGK